METKLNEDEVLKILFALEAMNQEAELYKEVAFESEKEFLLDLKETRMLHNKLLIQAQNEGLIGEDASLL
jgi:hypothetical protein